MKTLDVDKHLEQVAEFMLITTVMAVFIGFSLGWLARIVATI